MSNLSIKAAMPQILVEGIGVVLAKIRRRQADQVLQGNHLVRSMDHLR